ncbi:MAG: hypothetical protein GY804_09725 [Alphaproteobacteria bacterium]|nr:hypothetical protein [Alphaproteobacteria bacterium]
MAKMLQDDAGNTSSIRMMSFISLFSSIWFGYLGITLNNGGGSEFGLYASGLFLLGAFAPKAIQKLAENQSFMSRPTK